MNNQSKSNPWIDPAGIAIPANRISKIEKLRERLSSGAYHRAKKLSDDLLEFKRHLKTICEEVYTKTLAENGADVTDRKGNFTWYNFDRSIKIEVNINEGVDFDDILMEAAKDKLNTFLEGESGSMDDMIRQLVLQAFETSKGKLDSKRVFQLISYRGRLKGDKYQLFHEACDLITKAMRKTDSRTYYRIFARNEDGKYEAIDLNFSSVS